MPNASRQLISLILGAIFIGSCAYRPIDVAPIPAIEYQAPVSTGKSLVVFFPGYRDKPEDFQQYGFIQLLNRYYPHVDSVAIDSHIGYLEGQTLVKRVYKDVISPAIERGYEKITLVGISLGGIGALWTGYELRNYIDSMVLIAPYLAGANAVSEVEKYGSIRAWMQTLNGKPTQNQQGWYWLDSLLADEKFRKSIVLAYGRNDRSAPLADLLAEKLPDNQVFTNDGDHKWNDWIPLWERVLSQNSL